MFAASASGEYRHHQREEGAVIVGTGVRWTGRLLIVLALFSLGCAWGDWTTETLTLVDVTGMWEGPFVIRPSGGAGYERRIRWVLQQNGPKVTGRVEGLGGVPIGTIEGRVKGEVFGWRLTGAFVSTVLGRTPSQTYRGDATVNSDELSGRADGWGCPCTLLLRRVTTEAVREKPQM